MAIVLPVMMLLLMGGFDASLLIINKMTAGNAVRQGARLAAELGGTQSNPNLTTQQIDFQVVRNVLAVTQGLTDSSVTEVDVYRPSRADGFYAPGDPIDQYFISAGGAITIGTQTFLVTNRNQTPPTETSIGVRLLWTYRAPAGVFPSSMSLSDYCVMKAAPILT